VGERVEKHRKRAAGMGPGGLRKMEVKTAVMKDRWSLKYTQWISEKWRARRRMKDRGVFSFYKKPDKDLRFAKKPH